MPLYTYVACYKGGTYLNQDSKSNFKGFAALLIGAMPEQSLPDMDKPAIKIAVEKSYRASWVSIPNRENVWRTGFDLNGSEFTLYAVQTARS